MIAAGEIDAIILYRSIASRFPDFAVVELDPPLDMADRIRFTAGAIVRDGRSHPLAEPFLDVLCGPAGQAILARHHFLPPI
jgi:ABC-type molybdate transport system substrate-binding protein